MSAALGTLAHVFDTGKIDRMTARVRAMASLQAALFSDLVDIADDTPVAEFASFEIAAALTWTRLTATTQLELAHTVVRRLPALHAAMSTGNIDLPKARVIADAVTTLDDPAARNVVAAILPDAPGLTTGQLRARLAKLVIATDPDTATKRHHKRTRERRVELQPTDDSCATLLGLNLPADTALAAANHLTTLARAIKQAGDPRTLDQLRADTFLNLLQGTHCHHHHHNTPTPTNHASTSHHTNASNHTSASHQADASNHSGARHHADASNHTSASHQSSASHHAAASNNYEASNHTDASNHTAASHHADASNHASASCCARRTGGVELTADLQTLTRLAEHPGDLRGYGPVIADIARQVAQQQRQSPWSFTIHDLATGDIFTGTTRQRPTTTTNPDKDSQQRPDTTQRKPNASSGKPAEGATGKRPDADNRQRHKATSEQRPSPGQDFADPTRRRPTAAVARHVRARDRTCRAPGCRRPAIYADLDHTIAYELGGLTVPGNLGALCRYHHRAKHEGLWVLVQVTPGVFIWRSPLGRRYIVHPSAP